MSRIDRALVWFRRDLRAQDHTALHHALREARAVWCVFVFDTDILDALDDRADRRVEFIWHAVASLRKDLEAMGGGLEVLHGSAAALVPGLAEELAVDAVYANHDYEPAAIARDARVEQALIAAGRRLRTFKDQVILEKDEVLTQAGRPFSVFTPYRRAWLSALRASDLESREVHPHRAAFAPPREGSMPSLDSLGFRRTNLTDLALPLGADGARRLFDDFETRMDAYRDRRDFPALRGPFYLSVHLRFGTISIRTLAAAARRRATAGAEGWLSELIWREFYFQILWHFPHVIGGCFKREYDALVFENREDWFAAWCEGRTGYPLVDAAMRQLNTSGYMHNRLRMVTASFLVKDLCIDWRWGERYFAARLNDFDLSANNGGWQWAASTGCDAQPYFRIFNPVSQSEKFDPEARFIRLYVPELADVPGRFVHAPWTAGPPAHLGAYPRPIVEHAEARARALAMFGAIRGGAA